jgi:flagellar motor switch protein FliM
MNRSPRTGRIPNASQTLDPRALGRPVHLLPTFVAPLRDDLSEVFRTNLNRRYRASFELGAVTIAQLDAVPERCRWLGYADETGRIGFALERQLLLCILDYRYGAREARSSGATDASAWPPETATEERLASMLGRQFVAALAERIEWLPQTTGGATLNHEFSESATNAPRTGTWAIRAEVSEPACGIAGSLWFTLDDGWMKHLLARLAPQRENRRTQADAAKPLASRLQLKLVGRLLEKEIPLGLLLDTRVGDVIPVRLGETEVLVDNERLMTARVAEHKGKLCLTAFEDLE